LVCPLEPAKFQCPKRAFNFSLNVPLQILTPSTRHDWFEDSSQPLSEPPTPPIAFFEYHHLQRLSHQHPESSVPPPFFLRPEKEFEHWRDYRTSAQDLCYGRASLRRESFRSFSQNV